MSTSLQRCGWCGDDALYQAYHDEEWGVPSRDDRHLFEMLILEGAQAGLSWITILRKREGYRTAFQGFDAERVACFGAAEIEQLMVNPGIVRNRLKIQAAIVSARGVLDIRRDHGSFADFLWQFVDGRPIRNTWKSYRDAPTSTPQSDAMSKALKTRGFKFVGTTICYAFMQAVGMVDDHEIACYRHLTR